MAVLGEDVEDDCRAVERRAAEEFLEVELLPRRQLVVEDHGVGIDGEGQFAQLLRLALADVVRGIRCAAPLRDASDDVGTGGVDEALEFVEALVHFFFGVVVENDADDDDLLPDRALNERATESLLVRGVHPATSKRPT